MAEGNTIFLEGVYALTGENPNTSRAKEDACMNVLIVKNVSSEGPGTIEEHLRRECIPYSMGFLLPSGSPRQYRAHMSH